MSPILNKILRSAALYWSVPEPYLIVPTHRLERVIITTALLDQKTRALVEKNTDLFKPGNFKNKATCNSHPYAALIGELPLMDEVGFVKTWTETQSLNKAMEEATQKHLLNPLLKKYGHLLMRFTVDFCTLWAIQPPIMLDG